MRKTDRRVVDGKIEECKPVEELGPVQGEVQRTKLHLAAELIIKVAQRFTDITFRLVADHLYGGRNVLKTVHDAVDNVTVVVRGRSDAALYDLPAPRKPGQMGRPRVKGARLSDPTTWATQNAKKYLLDGHKLAASLAPAPDPWYHKTSRPSFTEMLAALRRLSWTEPFAHESSNELPIRELLAAYLARVAAAA